MRVLQVCPLFPPTPKNLASGVTQVVYSISKELVRRGHTVEVYTSGAVQYGKLGRTENKSEQVLVDGIRVHYFPYLMHYYTFFFTPTIISTAKKSLRDYDLIHIHDFRTFQGIVIAYYARRFKIPYVVQAHGTLDITPNVKVPSDLPKRILDSTSGFKSMKNASKVIALSQVEAHQYRALGVSEKKIEIIPNGVDLSVYSNLPSDGVFKRKFGIPAEKKIILYLGRINKSKGLDFLVKAYAYLSRKKNCPHSFLVIAGPDDGYMQEARRLVSTFGVADRTLFTGRLLWDEKVSAYADSSVVVNVEPKNVFGLVPIEAAACSRPVIVCRGNAVSDIVAQGEFGVVCEYGDTDQLSGLLCELLENDDLRMEMGEKGRRFVFENYGWTRRVDRLEEVYEEIVCR